MIDHSIEAILEQLKKKKKIKQIPLAPRQKSELVRQQFKNTPEVMRTMEIYSFFKRIDDSRAIKECEFRKDVRLKVVDNGQEIIINLDKLKEFSLILESFISYVKQFILSK